MVVSSTPTNRVGFGAGHALIVAVWISAGIFGAYILAFYGGSLAGRRLESWNDVLPRVYDSATPAATAAIGVHLAAGGIILLLGCVQLITPLCERVPRLHRVLGRIYLAASLLAGLGGLGFIVIKGTVGGPVMSLGFGLYGALMVVCAVQAFRHARARRIDQHRAWALRLFALAIGSWLYRMDYGFWSLITDGAGHTELFRGWFDKLMAFWFYLPNLLLVELILRSDRPDGSAATRGLRVLVQFLLAGATLFVLLGTWFFTTQLWGPSIVAAITSL